MNPNQAFDIAQDAKSMARDGAEISKKEQVAPDQAAVQKAQKTLTIMSLFTSALSIFTVLFNTFRSIKRK